MDIWITPKTLKKYMSIVCENQYHIRQVYMFIYIFGGFVCVLLCVHSHGYEYFIYFYMCQYVCYQWLLCTVCPCVHITFSRCVYSNETLLLCSINAQRHSTRQFAILALAFLPLLYFSRAFKVRRNSGKS